MKVKDRLSLQFTFMFAVLLLLVLTGIYLFVEQNRYKTFFDKLDDRAVTVAQFYLAEDNLSKENFKNVLKNSRKHFQTKPYGYMTIITTRSSFMKETLNGILISLKK